MSTPECIAKLSVEKFKSLPKTGKPNKNEWTVLSTIVQECQNAHKVVALGCGTKCMGKNGLQPSGLIINDAHAEVLARRAFLRHVYNELEKATQSRIDSIFEFNGESASFSLKNGIKFHFFCTQTPCGDACIDAEANNAEDNDDGLAVKRRKLEDSASDDDLYTGARLIDVEPGHDEMRQTMCAVRTKPGRGDRTLSVSCSDKLAKWCVLGVQGALLDSVLTQPIYFATLNFACDHAKRGVLQRAFYDRWQSKKFVHDRYIQQRPIIRICTSKSGNFEYNQQSDRQPSPNGLVWCDLSKEKRAYEICVNGIRQGVTKQKLNTPQASLHISKYQLLQSYVNLLRTSSACVPKRINVPTNEILEAKTYADIKRLAVSYQNAWQNIKSDYFGQWTHKPIELSQFSLSNTPSPYLSTKCA